MSVLKKIKNQVMRRKMRVRNNIRKAYDNNKFRVSVFRSLNYIYGQVIDDQKSKTIFSVSTKDCQVKDVIKKNKTVASFDAGIILGKKILDSGCTEIVFDRGQYLYHGRVKAFADGIRSAGIIF